MMRIKHILALTLLLLAGCARLDEPDLQPAPAPDGTRVRLTFKVAVPGEARSKAIGMEPTIDEDGFYSAVFGGSGYFNEWVQATVEEATDEYDGTDATTYTLAATLAVSDSRLRLHFIANCPEDLRSSPPISGSRDTEEYVLSRIRSQLTEDYNDGYWQKVILPNGVKAILEDEVYVATEATLAQFPDPIILVRNFARVYLHNVTPTVGIDELDNAHQLVTIRRFGLAYAPAEGVIAPILSEPYTSDRKGRPIAVADNDETTPVYYESFFMNYQRYSISSENPADTLLTSAPFNYGGYSPSDQSYDYYPAAGHSDRGIPVAADLQEWDSEHPENNVLFVYERMRPTTDHRATRIIIEAERVDQNDVSDGVRYYALDIVNTDGVSIPLLRNQTYTVKLLDIEAGSGETTIAKAAKAASAAVSGDPDYQDLINVSDGKSTIGASFTEKFYVKPQTDSVMFRYIPTNVGDDNYAANVEGNDLVSIQVGVLDMGTGVFTVLTPAEASSRGVLAFKTQAGSYRVWIVKDNGGHAVPYVRQNNAWVAANASQLADPSVEKWGMIKYELSESYLDEENYFDQERSQAIHIGGTYNGKEISRNVVIRTSPRQEMRVICEQRYLLAAAGQQEVVRVLIPTGLSRSVFPLEFILEPDGYSLTPNGDNLPVDYGTSVVPGNNSPAFYFIKSLSQTDYDRLGTIFLDGALWKTFECHFKTTLSNNACTVYVNSPFFNSSDAHDEFFNYVQRTFDNPAFTPTTVYHNANVNFSFTLDDDHSGSTVVWWDPENSMGQSADEETAEAKGLSTSNRVLPPYITVTLSNLTLQYREDGVTPVTAALEHYSGNTYLYYTGTGAPTSSMADVNLALVATGSIGATASVTLSTANIRENPSLYVSRTYSGAIEGASFTSRGFSPDPLPLGMNQTTSFSFSYVQGLVEPITISLSNLVPTDLSTGDNAFLRANGDGSYTFTPTDPSDYLYTITLKSTHRYNAGTVTLSCDDYDTLFATIERAGTIVIPAGKIYARGYGNVNPVKLQSNTVTVSATEGSGSAGTCTFNTTTFLNTAAVSINTASFEKNDGATVYFRYTNNNRVYNNGHCTLDDLMDIIEGTSNQVSINLYRWTTEDTYTLSFTRDNYQRDSFEDDTSGITIDFTNCEAEISVGFISPRKDIGVNKLDGSFTIDTSGSSLTNCKLTGATFTYFDSIFGSPSNTETVSASTGSISNDKGAWTASDTSEGNGASSVVITMGHTTTKDWLGRESTSYNAITSLTVNYAYWDY